MLEFGSATSLISLRGAVPRPMRDQSTQAHTKPGMCPSADQDAPSARIIGVVDHSRSPPQLRYLSEGVTATPDVVALTEPLEPTAIFRFAGECVQTRCSHWKGSCSLVARLVTFVPVTSVSLAPCSLRPTCQWFRQVGRRACQRCALVVTSDRAPSDVMRIVAAPPTPAVQEPDKETNGRE